jgi:hypothetical protein
MREPAMSDRAIVEEISRAVSELDARQQQRVLAYIHSMKTRPTGGRPESLLRMAGRISIADCLEIERAINEGCGQVNLNTW